MIDAIGTEGNRAVQHPSVESIEGSQITQADRDRLPIHIVPSCAFGDEDLGHLMRELRARLGDELRLPFYATAGTAAMLHELGADCHVVGNTEHHADSAVRAIEDGEIALVIDVPRPYDAQGRPDGFRIRRGHRPRRTAADGSAAGTDGHRYAAADRRMRTASVADGSLPGDRASAPVRGRSWGDAWSRHGSAPGVR